MGQNHWQISFDFLTEEKGLGAEEAEQKLADAHLFHPVVEGFETWNFFDGETFGSFVTQDDARVSPGTLMRKREAEAEQAETRMRNEIADLRRDLRLEENRRTAEIDRLESELDVKSAEAESLRSHIEALHQHREQLTARLEGLRSRLNSVYYLAGTETELRARGKIEAPFLDIGGMRLGALDSEDFENDVDLRDGPEIELQAENFELDRIGDVAVLPDRWEKNRDYEVRIAGDGSSATIQLLRPDEFRLKTVVFVVGS